MRPVFDVSAYGAAGDGVTNDHDAIVRALYREYLPTQFGLHRVPRFDPDEGAVLRFGPGRYRIDGTLAAEAARNEMAALGLAEPCNGFWHGKAGLEQIAA